MSDLKTDLAALRIEREPDRARAGRWVGWAILIVLLGGGGFAAWKWFTRERPIEVQFAAVTERAAGTQAAVLNASGYVTARRRATISSKVTGKVMEVNVEEGMAVKEGQILARLDDTTPRAALALAEAQAESARHALQENEVRLAQARLTLGRLTDLLKDGIVTKAEVDLAKTDVDATIAKISALGEQTKVAERQVDVQKSDLDNMIIRAPFSGIAVTKDAQPGEMVSPVSAGGGFTRTGICTIVDMRSLEIDVDVNESYINRVKPGQHVSAVLDAYPDWQIPAHVITVVPTADRQKATVQVRIAFEDLDPRLLPDMGVKVTFLREAGAGDAPAAAQATMLVPKAAVQTENGQTVAYVAAGDTATRRAVRVGGTDGDRLEVLAGLRAGDRVILTPAKEIKDGAKIVVK
jgi:RND family efflux transporter MFP subunit